jgi:hypothetical protein
VSKAETIARLNKLLERVRTRAGARLSASSSAIAPDLQPAPAEEPVQLSTWTPPPPEEGPAPEVNIAVDVDYVEATQVSASDPSAESDGSSRFDSTERLVAASTEVGEISVDEGPPLVADVPMDVVEEEPAEPAPASSRRPVMPEPEDRLEQMAFGAGEARPPLHTPPPESGRVPAAPADEFDSEPPGMPNEPLVPELIRAVIEPSASVAQLVSYASRAFPTTFSALLDETLSL